MHFMSHISSHAEKTASDSREAAAEKVTTPGGALRPVQGSKSLPGEGLCSPNPGGPRWSGIGRHGGPLGRAPELWWPRGRPHGRGLPVLLLERSWRAASKVGHALPGAQRAQQARACSAARRLHDITKLTDNEAP